MGAEGPTRLVTVRDRDDDDDGPEQAAPAGTEWGFAGSVARVGLSLVARGEELLYVSLGGLRVTGERGAGRARLTLGAERLQADNQLPDTSSPVLLAVDAGDSDDAALRLELEAAEEHREPFVRHAVLALRPLVVRLEERLLLKLWSWAAPPSPPRPPDEPPADPPPARAARYYFELVRVAPARLRLSMSTGGKLEPELAALRRSLALTLINFEDAAVELEPFVRTRREDSPAGLAAAALQHFREQLKWQAAKILGSVDFLGNPLGFVADVSEGVSGLIHEGSVGALLKNVTHGISNSAAKVTGE